jgi:hypothetical protein
MLIDEASNLNLYDGPIDIKFSIEICRHSIPSTNWRNSNDDQYISKGSIINKELHESFLESPISDENS